ncbi:MAG: hypothetical protein K8R23_03770 [Chthoniobacter sp.]|nr:hypothetical protein [Chthoniobacter sp.]
MKSLNLTLLSLISLTAVAPVFACDLCGCYTPRLEVVHTNSPSFFAGVGEQFTHFGTVRVDGRDVGNPTGQYLDSSITQFVLGARFLENRIGLQLNIPLIYRSYERPNGFATERGHESGLGDVSLLANWIVFKTATPVPARGLSKDGKGCAFGPPEPPEFSASVNVLAGIKFPTGDASRLREEFSENEVEGAPESGIHGHDLALGTGSYDGVFGLQVAVRYRAVFFQADAQYALRGAGRYSYRYAHDFSWTGGPGVELKRRGEDVLALQCVLSGETKGLDQFRGARAEDTGLTSLYVGPRVLASWGRVSGEVAVDLPVLMNTTALQTTPDYRIRAGFTIRF